MEFLEWVKQSGFATWVREADSLWAYPMVITFHAFGMGILAGLNVALDLRLLGFAPRVPLAALGRLFPLMWFGFWINALSGVVLLMVDPAAMLLNWVFEIKMGLLALAIVNTVVIRRRLLRDSTLDTRPIPMNGRILAVTSLVLWCAALTAGRLTAYFGHPAFAPLLQ